jgi:hypothetical protein
MPQTPNRPRYFLTFCTVVVPFCGEVQGVLAQFLYLQDGNLTSEFPSIFFNVSGVCFFHLQTERMPCPVNEPHPMLVLQILENKKHLV